MKREVRSCGSWVINIIGRGAANAKTLRQEYPQYIQERARKPTRLEQRGAGKEVREVLGDFDLVGTCEPL